MEVVELAIPEVKLISVRRFADDRGYFSETFNAGSFESAGVDCGFVQDNQSYSRYAGTVRGLHYQSPPHAQDKLVRVTRGRILDVAVDVRVGSPSYGRWVAAELSDETGDQLFIPKGFLHGFVTREDDTVVQYKVSAYYSPECDGAVLWSDPDLAIDWEVERDLAVLSEKDTKAPRWAEFQSPFKYASEAVV